MKVLSIVNLKGGVGKTTSAYTVAHILSTAFKKKVLLIDVDSQGNTTSMFLPKPVDLGEMIKTLILEEDLNIVLPTDFSLEDLLLDTTLDPHKAILHTKYENLDVIPSFITLAECEERLKADVRTPQQFKLKAQITKLDGEYDFVIMDCSPSLSILNINALAASTDVLVPIKTDLWSIAGLVAVKQLIRDVLPYNPQLKFFGTFITVFERNLSAHKLVYETLEECLEGFIPVTIRKSTLVEQSTITQSMLFDEDRFDRNRAQEKIAQDYYDLTKYIVDTI